MPYSDAEKQREYQRKWAAANRDRLIERIRENRAKSRARPEVREAENEYRRRYRASKGIRVHVSRIILMEELAKEVSIGKYCDHDDSEFIKKYRQSISSSDELRARRKQFKAMKSYGAYFHMVWELEKLEEAIKELRNEENQLRV